MGFCRRLRQCYVFDDATFKPEDWVIATGETHTVKEFLKIAFEIVELDYKDFVKTSEKYYRPNEVDYLLGDPSKAKKELNWNPKVSFKELCKNDDGWKGYRKR